MSNGRPHPGLLLQEKEKRALRIDGAGGLGGCMSFSVNNRKPTSATMALENYRRAEAVPFPGRVGRVRANNHSNISFRHPISTITE